MVDSDSLTFESGQVEDTELTPRRIERAHERLDSIEAEAEALIDLFSGVDIPLEATAEQLEDDVLSLRKSLTAVESNSRPLLTESDDD